MFLIDLLVHVIDIISPGIIYFYAEHWPIFSYSISTILHLTLNVYILTLKVLVATIDAQWEGMGDVGSARYEPALLPPCPTIRVLSNSN